ncbi:hypothetical protein H6P81_012892 [Aristolochia fimbriata]|uniref:Chloroplast sensor kinase, chloroplastic n=1 Tax=Aristolochia fimbriata TaxID=158543 RepID=A0AAV7EDG6_ARIFI|nr:hypothetical protein H6P81_012892 [Aristolochia fimbriata]
MPALLFALISYPTSIKIQACSPISKERQRLPLTSHPIRAPSLGRRGTAKISHAAASSLKNGVYPYSQNSEEGASLEGGANMCQSAAAVSAAIREASKSPVEIVQRVESCRDGKSGLVLPTADFQRLCVQQLDLFRTVVDPHAILSVYVRPAGSYVMDQLELRRVTFFPEVNGSETEVVILTVNFGMPTGLRSAEAALSKHQAQVIPECKAVVFPMVKHPFVVGVLVAELPTMTLEAQSIAVEEGKISAPLAPTVKKSLGVPSNPERNMWKIQAFTDDFVKRYQTFTVEQESRAIKIALSLAMAYVMDQKALLLQQSSWQNNVRMSNLVEQIRGPLSNIRTLSKMLSAHMKRSEVAYDIIEDILIQGDHMSHSLEQLQEAVYLTKANIMRYNEELLRKMRSSKHGHSGFSQGKDLVLLEGSSGTKDLEMPMPPLALAPLPEHNIRPCNVSEILRDLVMAAQPLAHKQKRSVQFMELSSNLLVAIEESDLRQALSNLIEGALLRTHVGGKVEILAISAPAGGALIIVDDDGPDMHYMTQMHSLTPFGAELFTEGMLEDNMTWNFIAGLTIAREILESYSCVVRVISPRSPEAALGAGGTRVELWLPSAVQTNPSPFPSEQEQQA